MGNAGTVYFRDNKPEYVPDSFAKITFDPEYGFRAPRKPRVAKISEEEMKALKIPKMARDYCAHLVKDIIICERTFKPLTGFCNPEYRAYHHCLIDDYIIRMKEYEREKRLRIRALKKQNQEVS